MTEELTRRQTLLDLILTNKEGMFVFRRPGHPWLQWPWQEFRILNRRSKTNIRITAMDFTRAAFILFNDLLERTSMETVLKRREVQDISLVFRDHILQAQEFEHLDQQEIKQRQQDAYLYEQGSPSQTQM